MFTTDNRTEQYLTSIGVKHHYREDISYDELFAEWNSAKNHGRPLGLQKIKSAIETYAEQMLGGSAAPAVVLHKTRHGLDVLDGIQRLNANAFCDHTKFCGYIVECSDETALKIRICINNRLAGVASNPPDFAIEQMVEMFMVRGTETAADVAEFVGRSRSDVEKYYGRAVAKNRIASLFPDAQAVPELRAEVYDTIATASEPTDFDGQAAKVCADFVDVLVKCKFPNGDAKRITHEFFGIRRIGNKDRAAQFRSKLQSIKRDPVVATRLQGKRESTQLDNMHRHFKTLLNCVQKHKGEVIECEEYVVSFDTAWHEIGRLLREQCSSELRRKLDPFV